MLKHRTFIFLISSLLTAFLVSSAVAQRGIVPVAIKNQEGKQVGLYKGSYALVIGVSDYTNGWPDLPGVDEDLNAVGEVLEQIGFLVYKRLNPNRKQLEEAFNGFISKHGYEKDNRLLIYFAGHGHTIAPKYGGTEMGYIVPSNAPNPNLNEQDFLRVGLSMQNIEVYARNIQSKHALFVFDSCFSGSIFSLSRAIPQIIQEKTNRPVRQFITAGRANQTVPDVSIFRRQFIKALKGDGDYNKDLYVTASELGQYLEDTVTNYSKGSQTPQYGKLRDPTLDQGDFVFPISASIQMEVVKDQIQSEQDMIKQARIEEQNKQQQALDKLKKIREDFAKELELLKQDREKTKRFQEELKLEKDAMAKLRLENQKTKRHQKQAKEEKEAVGKIASLSYDNIFSNLPESGDWKYDGDGMVLEEESNKKYPQRFKFYGGSHQIYWRIKDYYETFGKLATKYDCYNWANTLSRNNFGGFNNWEIVRNLDYYELVNSLAVNKTFPKDPRFEYWAGGGSVQTYGDVKWYKRETEHGAPGGLYKKYFRLWAKNSFTDPITEKLNCRAIRTGRVADHQ